MRLLKIKVDGLSLFPTGLEVDFVAQQRVLLDDTETLTHLFSNIYTNNVVSFVGMNASGKTTTLKVISFVLELLNNKPINTIFRNDILNTINDKEKGVKFKVYFMRCLDFVYCMEITIAENQEQKYTITAEKIWKKRGKVSESKGKLYDFSSKKPLLIRTFEEEYLLHDVSIIAGLNNKEKNSDICIDLVSITNENELRLLGDFPSELVSFLDPNIEYLTCTYNNQSNQYQFELKFKHSEEIILYSPKELEHYLSSGTIKGINVFMFAIRVLQRGGYLILDEIENHFHKEIASTLLQFFQNKSLNLNGACIIFTTHYPELLDVLDRNDSIFIVKNQKGIVVENLSKENKRNDLKKSEIFLSDCYGNTAPSYETYMDLQQEVSNLVHLKTVELEE